jgi:rubredoxin
MSDINPDEKHWHDSVCSECGYFWYTVKPKTENEVSFILDDCGCIKYGSDNFEPLPHTHACPDFRATKRVLKETPDG